MHVLRSPERLLLGQSKQGPVLYSIALTIIYKRQSRQETEAIVILCA